jgi:hypothetical protein
VASGGDAAQALLDDLIPRAAAAGVKAWQPEAFAQNERAGANSPFASPSATSGDAPRPCHMFDHHFPIGC